MRNPDRRDISDSTRHRVASLLDARQFKSRPLTDEESSQLADAIKPVAAISKGKVVVTTVEVHPSSYSRHVSGVNRYRFEGDIGPDFIGVSIVRRPFGEEEQTIAESLVDLREGRIWFSKIMGLQPSGMVKVLRALASQQPIPKSIKGR
ncbi:hypothetical protein A2Y99_01810 [Candidatus Gottesmanbacteria bacterium RBG_13_37_7]|uniref:Uncharacterized protein n=1 Tax=Candidatus Gottesmanbacteria bacterium RBG_13_37_7 TaxID=1798369 RepID=A0A1F5YII0_9BACT|nr:MAG: hypothetical protein A2Y99_01810 [Candidatus Gottesmanbacteria bacterium RBG_13_37_7]